MNARSTYSFLICTLLLGTPAFAQDAQIDPATVLAQTAKMTVTYEDLQAEMARIPEKDRLEFLMNRNRLATVVENILINKTLAAEARERKLDPAKMSQLIFWVVSAGFIGGHMLDQIFYQ